MSRRYQTLVLVRALAVLISAGMILPVGCGGKADREIRVAVASNFAETAKRLGKEFTSKTGRQVVVSSGSTGVHYAQIVNGAPFDAFLSADRKHAVLLEKKGIAVGGTRYTYASGRLVLWSARPGYVDREGKILSAKHKQVIAIANPRLAPYGIAASEVLRKLGNDPETEGGRIVRGENVAQVFQFVDSGNADIGFIALAQLKALKDPGKGSFWLVPQEFYTQIEQQAVLIKDSPGARDFLRFLREPESQELIRESGYGTP